MNLHPQLIIDASYFAAAFLFIYGLKRMSSPVTARSGIVVAGVGMLVATLASFLYVFGVDDAAQPHLTTESRARGRSRSMLGTGWAWWQRQACRDDGDAADGRAVQRHGRRRGGGDRRSRVAAHERRARRRCRWSSPSSVR